MYKKILIPLIMIIMVVGCFPASAAAAEVQASENTTIEYFDDGSYTVITITQAPIGRETTTTSTAGSKTATHYDANDKVTWTYTITAVFHYTGTSSECVSVSDSYSIKNDSWSMYSHSCSYSGNVATGNVTMKYKVLGVEIKTVSKKITLTCSATGKLS